MALSAPSFLPLAASTFSCARQIGTNAVVTAASARCIATWFAVLLVVQPPQLKPTIMVRMLPMIAPQTPGFIHPCWTCIRHLLVLRTMYSIRLALVSVAGRHPAWIVDQGPPWAVSGTQKGGEVGDEGVGLLDLGMVARALDELEARARDQRAVGPPVGRLHDPVAGSPEHEGRHPDPVQPSLELGVVHVGMPPVEGERLPVPGALDQLLVGHGVEVRRRPHRVVPASPPHFGG